MKKVVALGVMCSLAWAAPVMAQSEGWLDQTAARNQVQDQDAPLVLRAERQLRSNKTDGWLNAVSAPQATSSRLVINDVSPNPTGEARTPRVYGSESNSSKTDGWVKTPAPVAEAVVQQLVIRDVSPNPEGEVRTERTYNFAKSDKSDGWVKPAATRVEASDARLVVNYKNPNADGEVQLPRSYGFTRGALLPLVGAAGDSISTNIALHQANVVERNGLVNTSPAGLLGLFAIKAGAIYILDQQRQDIRKPGLKITAGLWNGVIVNNLLVAAGATNPVSVIAGIAYGAYMYQKEHDILEQEEALAMGRGEPMWETR